MFTKFVKLIILIYFKIFNRVKLINLKNIPETGAIILYANHISNADPLLVGCPIKRMTCFMAKQELFKNKLLNKFFKALGAFPVKRGIGDVSAIKNALLKLKEGNILCMFPEGARKKAGMSANVKPGLAMLAIRAKCPVIPAAVIGRGVPFKKVKVVYGSPIDLCEYYDKELSNGDYTQISKNLMKEVDKLMEL